MTDLRRAFVALAALLMVVAGATACGRNSDDATPTSTETSAGSTTGNVDTDDYDKLTLECQILTTEQIAKAVGGTTASGTFFGAICRWIVYGPTNTNVTFNWFEWGDYAVEKDTAKRLGYETENIRVASQVAFTQRDPKRPQVCGVTARAPSRGVYTWWVEPIGAAAGGDACAAPTKLMELVLHGGQ